MKLGKYILFLLLSACVIIGCCTSCSSTVRTTKRGQLHNQKTSHTHKKKTHHKSPKHKIKEFSVNQKLSAVQKELIEEALDWQGTPYKYGGAEKGDGTDCSGFVLRVYLDVTDIKFPRTSAQQSEWCRNVKMNDVKACDLVFFATGSDANRVSHVGMVLDKENFIHASSSKGVIVTRFDSPWWSSRILGFGRPPGMK